MPRSHLAIGQNDTEGLLTRARRILVVGCCGSGKSHLARALSDCLALPLVKLDDMYWRENWARPPQSDFESALREAVAQPAWIMDGDFVSCLPIRLARADLVLAFDLPTATCLTSVLWRDVKRAFSCEDLPLRVRTAARPRANPHRLRLWRHILRYHRTTRHTLFALLHSTGTPTVVLESRRDARSLMESLSR